MLARIRLIGVAILFLTVSLIKTIYSTPDFTPGVKVVLTIAALLVLLFSFVLIVRTK